MIYVTCDLHGGNSSYHFSSAQFKPAKEDHVITHTCPVNQKPYFFKLNRIKDPTGFGNHASS